MTDTFEEIELNRLNNGYTTNKDGKTIKSYKKFNNTNKNKNIIYKLERNLAIYKIINAPSYLSKNLRMLDQCKEKTEFIKTYTHYTNCLLLKHKNCLNVDSLVELRNKLCDYSTFLNDIYLINDGQYYLDSLRIPYTWHDIIIQFESQRLLDSFLENKFDLRDKRFNSLLADKAQSFNIKSEIFINSINVDIKEYWTILYNAEALSTVTDDLVKFLDVNYYDSNFISSSSTALHKICDFCKTVNVNAIVTNLGCFEKYRSSILSIVELEEAKLLKIYDKLESQAYYLGKEERKIPFGPIFYDLAFPYIDFPKDSSKSELSNRDKSKNKL